jgi:selenide,water dikinase
MKYGMAVIGEAHPKDILEIRGARVGSVLVLTKALGTGILNTAVKRAEVPKATYDTLIASMTRLNRDAAKCMAEFECYGCTDVTGFGLAGHGMEMAKASRVELVISTAKLPLLPGLADAVAQGCVTRGDRTNREYTEGRVTMDEKVSQLLQHVVFDPQTSGGLLISVRADQAEALVARLREAGDTAAAIVGDVRAHASGCLRFIP